MVDIASLRAEDFERLVGDRFAVAVDGVDGGEFELLAAEPQDTGHERVEAFAVMFLGVGVPTFDQQTVTLSHAAVGRFDLFVVAVAEDERGRRYEAVFTRLVD